MLATGKKLLFGALTTIGFFLALEAGLVVIGVDPRLRTTTLGGASGTTRGVMVGERDAAVMARTVLYNTRANPLTFPDARLIFRVRPDPAAAEAAGYQGINALGFRGPRIDHPERAPKIVVLGDSCVFGWGIRGVEQTFPHLLGRRLAQAGADYEVYNLGQPGYSTAQGLRLYRDWAAPVEPDLVILYFGWNDIWPTPWFTDTQTMAALRVTNHPIVATLSRSRTFGLLQRTLSAAGVLPDRTAEAPRESAYRARVGIDEAIDNLRQMSATSETIVIVPPFVEVGESAERHIRRYRASIADRLADTVRILFLEEMEPDAARARDYYQLDGFHPNHRGHQYIARQLADAILAPRR